MIRQILAVIKKDLRQAKRDPRFIAPAIIVPFALVAVYSILWTSIGGGESFVCGIVIEDTSSEAEEMAFVLENMVSTTNHTWFKTTRYGRDVAEDLFSRGEIMAFILIPNGFGTNITFGYQAVIVMYINNVNDDVVKNYVHRVEAGVLLYNQDAVYPEFNQSNAKVALDEELRLSETPSNSVYMGAAAILLSLMTCTIASQSMTTASEYETKAIYDVANSPTSRVAILLGKTISSVPRAFVSLMITAPVIVVTLSVTSPTNPLLLFFILILSIMGLAPLGELIGIIAKKKEQALLGSVLITVVGFFAGGGLAPITLTPSSYRWPSLLLPATYAMDLWTRVFFFNTLSGVFYSILALIMSWLILSLVAIRLMNREAESA